MSSALIAACLWLLIANAAALLPSRRHHWPQAYALMVVGLPLLVWLYLSDGIWYALVALIAAGSVLRYPLRGLVRRLRAGLARISQRR